MEYCIFVILLTATVLYFKRSEYDPNSLIADTSASSIRGDYDFIIVGAGSAGSVLANRLTEVDDWEVLLLEAGDEETVESQTPELAFYLWGGAMDWNYVTTPQIGCDGSCSYPRGKVLGGSSSINALVYLRGNKRDYDGWESQGNKGWSYNDVIKYFLLSEDSNIPGNDPGYHNVGGYQHVSRPSYQTKLQDAYLKGGEELGYSVTDLNGAPEHSMGFMVMQSTISNGTRCSANKAFLRPIRNRKNLNVAKNAFVRRIIITDNRAVGVEFEKDGRTIIVNAKKEVILSAGVINSAQLLMLSGIGPKEHLESLNILLKADLPVGFNLQDHVDTPVYFTVDPGVGPKYEEVHTPETIVDYARNSTGPLASPMINEVVALVNVNQDGSGYPDTEIVFESLVPQLGANLSNWGGFTTFLTPTSRGRITLRTTDPHDHPIIDPNYFASEIDLKTAFNGVKFVYELSKTSALNKYNSTFYHAYYEKCSNETFPSDKFFMCMVKRYSVSAFHPVGTCKMGQDHLSSVVDQQLKVHKVSNLRVIDASIMPTLPSANTNAPTIMIAEKGADLIKKDYLQPTKIIIQ